MSTPASYQVEQRVIVRGRDLAFVKYVRMAPPDYARPEAVSVEFRNGRQAIYPAADIAPVETGRYEGKATIWAMGDFGFGYRPIEARDLTWEWRPFAQHPRALYLDFAKKGSRGGRYSMTHADVVVFSGWGHPEDLSPSMWRKTEDKGEVIVSVGRYASCDPRWRTDFDRNLRAYLEAHRGVSIVLDGRFVREPTSREAPELGVDTEATEGDGP